MEFLGLLVDFGVPAVAAIGSGLVAYALTGGEEEAALSVRALLVHEDFVSASFQCQFSFLSSTGGAERRCKCRHRSLVQ